MIMMMMHLDMGLLHCRLRMCDVGRGVGGVWGESGDGAQPRPRRHHLLALRVQAAAVVVVAEADVDVGPNPQAVVVDALGPAPQCPAVLFPSA